MVDLASWVSRETAFNAAPGISLMQFAKLSLKTLVEMNSPHRCYSE
jgi:hypothetical protein